jgi:hypothetical protein
MPTLGGGEKLAFNMPSTYTRKIEFSSVRVGFLSSRKIGNVGLFLL